MTENTTTRPLDTDGLKQAIEHWHNENFGRNIVDVQPPTLPGWEVTNIDWDFQGNPSVEVSAMRDDRSEFRRIRIETVWTKVASDE